ncbi:hypothetical protein [Butyrivibrio sp. YAB3001]|uniref:hypothetical protein n=1 Tax=Butyrivibrio sp. YAB3001 TaxID=1520812 RepID=UPI0008F6762C|nr:hypothetical protein [Butyrivibrio sp. YAB3001]SFC33826.1 hypothetical protein SAMN02910398_02019 [Butyrivibrio sp. YAB3001]
MADFSINEMQEMQRLLQDKYKDKWEPIGPETGESTTFFCHIRNVQMDERLSPKDTFDIDLTVLDPVIYSGKYHSLGKKLGEIGDFL